MLAAVVLFFFLGIALCIYSVLLDDDGLVLAVGILVAAIALVAFPKIYAYENVDMDARKECNMAGYSSMAYSYDDHMLTCTGNDLPVRPVYEVAAMNAEYLSRFTEEE